MTAGLNPVLLATLAVLNAPLYYLAYRVIFKDWEEFTEAVWFWLKPDLWSAFRGEFFQDMWAEIKLGLLFAACSGAVYLEAFAIQTQFLQ
ncbi:MAG TPA: hypothetical protein P5069_12235 [Candidatus Hydrogenedentes bacterium]|nr:hypothetical protein [Candidatus Hydrogenedentota bacterium]